MRSNPNISQAKAAGERRVKMKYFYKNQARQATQYINHPCPGSTWKRCWFYLEQRLAWLLKAQNKKHEQEKENPIGAFDLGE
jgi:hypothetical protein